MKLSKVYKFNGVIWRKVRMKDLHKGDLFKIEHADGMFKATSSPTKAGCWQIEAEQVK